MSIPWKTSRWRNPFPTRASPAFAAVSTPMLAFIAIVATLAIQRLGAALWPGGLDVAERPLADALIWVVFYAVFGGLLWLESLKAGIAGALTFGRWPGWRRAWIFASLAVPFLCVSEFLAYAVFLPLSYADPDFVSWWLLDELPVIWWRADPAALGASAINVALMVVAAPVVEEVFFRGFVLNRLWWHHGMWQGVVVSSLVFGLLHADFLGAFVFAFVLALIYVRTKSLIGPIIVHMANNGAIVLMILGDGAIFGAPSAESLEHFRAHWWVAPICAVIGLPWLFWYIRGLFRERPA